VGFRFSRRYIGSSLINLEKVLPFALEEVSPKSVCRALKSPNIIDRFKFDAYSKSCVESGSLGGL
jgi:hypothetical protein